MPTEHLPIFSPQKKWGDAQYAFSYGDISFFLKSPALSAETYAREVFGMYIDDR